MPPQQPVRPASLTEVKEMTAARDVPLVLFDEVVEGAWPFRIRHLDFLSLYVAERGRGLHIIDSIPYAISRGDVYVMKVGSDHTFAESERLLVRGIHFPPEIFDAATWAALRAVPGFDVLLMTGRKGHRLHLAPDAYAGVASDLAELWAEWRSGTGAGALLVRALFVRLLIRLARLASGDSAPALQGLTRPADRAEIVAAAVRTIDVNYAQPLRIRELASSVHLSADHFSKLFSSVMGRTPRDYLRHVRLEHAKTLLKTTDMPISHVAGATGFHDNAYFARAFRSATGRSPRAFRRTAQQAR